MKFLKCVCSLEELTGEPIVVFDFFKEDLFDIPLPLSRLTGPTMDCQMLKISCFGLSVITLRKRSSRSIRPKISLFDIPLPIERSLNVTPALGYMSPFLNFPAYLLVDAESKALAF